MTSPCRSVGSWGPRCRSSTTTCLSRTLCWGEEIPVWSVSKDIIWLISCSINIFETYDAKFNTNIKRGQLLTRSGLSSVSCFRSAVRWRNPFIWFPVSFQKVDRSAFLPCCLVAELRCLFGISCFRIFSLAFTPNSGFLSFLRKVRYGTFSPCSSNSSYRDFLPILSQQFLYRPWASKSEA